MEFRFKTRVLLNKEFVVEAESPKEAMRYIEKQLAEDPNLSSYDVIQTEFDITDPSVCEYNKRECKRIIEEYKKECKNESN